MLTPFTAHIESFDEQTVKLKTADRQAIQIPRSSLFGTPQIGQAIFLIATLQNSDEIGKSALAQAVINELLGPNA